MNLKKLTAASLLLLSGALGMTGTAVAAPVLCLDDSKNHMLVEDSLVSACLAAGVGNLTGNLKDDLFLNSTAGTGYTSLGKNDEPAENTFNVDFDQDSQSKAGSTGTFSFDPSAWDLYSGLAIGFKFGTGGNPDNWFVYQLTPRVSFGDWLLVKTAHQGGGLSHVNLYGIVKTTSVPEPATLALMGLALTGLVVARRRKQASLTLLKVLLIAKKRAS